MPWYDWPIWVLTAAITLILAYGVALVLRRRVLSRSGGTFELSHRVRVTRPGRGWQLGMGRYSGNDLEWFRVFTLSSTPKRVWHRSDLTYESSHAPVGLEASAIYPEHLVVTCSSVGTPVELAMSPQALIGFQAWLESRNPGTDWSRGR
jgi:hypothetical protein